MEGTLEASGTSDIPFRGKPVLCKNIKIHFWKEIIVVSWSYYLKGRIQGGTKEYSGD